MGGLCAREGPASYNPADGAELAGWWTASTCCTLVLRGNDRGWWREEMRAGCSSAWRPSGRAAELCGLRRPGPGAEGGGITGPRVVFALSADEWLLAAVREAPTGWVVIVTADRQLADRARHRGAQVVSPRAFLARCAPS
jgi:hypothetical protein